MSTLKNICYLWFGVAGMFLVGTGMDKGGWIPKPCPPPALKPVYLPVVYKPRSLQVREVSATVYYPTGDLTYDGTATPRGKALSNTRWCALSHDLLRMTGWEWGDTVLVYGKNLPNKHWGLYILHDKTHSRLRNRIDLLVPNHTYSDKWDGVLVRKFTLKDPT